MKLHVWVRLIQLTPETKASTITLQYNFAGDP